MKKCKICKIIITGRSDKIFCSVKCKNIYHKDLRIIAQTAGIQIDRFLKRNYKILFELMEGRKTQLKVYRNKLSQKGFRFKYHTHTHINSKSKMHYFIYDFAWMEFSDDEILIVKR